MQSVIIFVTLFSGLASAQYTTSVKPSSFSSSSSSSSSSYSSSYSSSSVSTLRLNSTSSVVSSTTVDPSYGKSSSSAIVSPTSAYSVCSGHTDGFVCGVGCCIQQNLVSDFNACFTGLHCKKSYSYVNNTQTYDQNDDGDYFEGDNTTYVKKDLCQTQRYHIDPVSRHYVQDNNGAYWKDAQSNYWNIQVNVTVLITVPPSNVTITPGSAYAPNPGTDAVTYQSTGQANLASSYTSSAWVSKISLTLMIVSVISLLI